jgi:hypothetical protein
VTRKYRLTSVDKFHGRNPRSEIIELTEADFASAGTLGAALRKARVLMPGQRVRSFRGPTAWERGESTPGTLNGQPCPTRSPYAQNPIAADAVIVFPGLAHGLTTGIHSITITPVKA